MEASEQRGWEEPFDTLEWDAEGVSVDDATETIHNNESHSEAGSGEVEEGEADYDRTSEEGLRQLDHAPEIIEARDRLHHERVVEEIAQKLQFAKWTWDKAITSQCFLIVRHDGIESIADILNESNGKVTVEADNIIIALKQQVPSQQRTILTDAPFEEDEDRINIIFQKVPAKREIANLEEEERKSLAQELFKEVLETIQIEGPQACELRFLRATDHITEIMAENHEVPPWQELQPILDTFTNEVLEDLHLSEGIAVSMQC